MFTVRAQDIEGTELDVHCPKGGFRSLRMLLADKGMGFSVHKTLIPSGASEVWHYKHHVEACYCIAGSGRLTNLDNNKTYRILPDTMYVLDKHDRHRFTATSDVVLISIFNPPCTGTEVHGEDGSYEAAKGVYCS